MPAWLTLTAAKALFGRVPKQVWIGIGAALALLALVLMHQHAAHKAIKQAYAQGKADESAAIAKKALEIKTKLDTITTRISATIKERSHEENNRIDASAADLFLHDAGKAACTSVGGIPATPSGNRSSGGPIDGGLAEVPSAGGTSLLAVPQTDAASFAVAADKNRAEVISWRLWYQLTFEAWQKVASPASTQDHGG